MEEENILFDEEKAIQDLAELLVSEEAVIEIEEEKNDMNIEKVFDYLKNLVEPKHVIKITETKTKKSLISAIDNLHRRMVQFLLPPNKVSKAKGIQLVTLS
jgi:hypothetical protein